MKMASDSEKTTISYLDFVDLGVLMDNGSSSDADSESEEVRVPPPQASSINVTSALLGAGLSLVGVLGVWLYSKKK